MGVDVNVPSLRFPQFSESWSKKKIHDAEILIIDGDRGTNYPNGNDFSKDGYCLFLNAKNVTKNGFSFVEKSFITKEKDEQLRKGKLNRFDIVLTTRGSVGHISYYDSKVPFEHLRINSGMVLIRTNQKKISSDYLYKYFNSNQIQKEINTVVFGSAQPQLTVGEISKFNIAFPNIIEQTKIASFLTAVDDKLQALKKKKELLEQYKKGMMQQLFSQEIRFKKDDGTNYPDWEWKKLSEVSLEHLTKNTRNDVTEVFSVSKHKGVINQIEHLGRSFSSKEISNYKVIFHGDLVYTKSPTSEFPFGIIKQNRTKRVGVVSPLYCVFKPVTIELGYILHEYFYSRVNTFNYLNPLVQKGAKNTMNINNETFLNGAELFLPIDNEEQTKIANFLSALDDKIAHCQSELDGLEQWKKGLLQQMFC